MAMIESLTCLTTPAGAELKIFRGSYASDRRCVDFQLDRDWPITCVAGPPVGYAALDRIEMANRVAEHAVRRIRASGIQTDVPFGCGQRLWTVTALAKDEEAVRAVLIDIESGEFATARAYVAETEGAQAPPMSDDELIDLMLNEQWQQWCALFECGYCGKPECAICNQS
ncbi:hypothetical protein [Frankia sp. Cj3]|uniref:hypothetical protein n=1 Tax=Frankia sp. Cj3 TaxID=2880976 RepID=UPI001EF4253A|nr:hypothetical protein [Frankia sp. Cj3]